MGHPLYYHAVRFVGKPVYAAHRNGNIYHGVLSTVTQSGVYLLNCRPVTHFANFHTENTLPISTLPNANQQISVTPELIFAPGLYFTFGALTGLTLGALAYYW